MTGPGEPVDGLAEGRGRPVRTVCLGPRRHFTSRRRHVLKTALRSEECAAILKRKVTRVATPFGVRSAYIGDVWSTRFEIQYIGGDARAGGRLPILAAGRFEERPGGTRIELEFGTAWGSAIGTAAGLVVCSAVGLVALYRLVSERGDAPALYVLGLPFLGAALYCLWLLSRDNTLLDGKIIALLESALDAKPVAPSHGE